MNCCVVPSAMLKLGGVTAIDASVAAVTVNVTGAEFTGPSVALTCALPMTTVVASPDEPEALLTTATVLLSEDQVTWLVRFWMELSV